MMEPVSALDIVCQGNICCGTILWDIDPIQNRALEALSVVRSGAGGAFLNLQSVRMI